MLPNTKTSWITLFALISLCTLLGVSLYAFDTQTPLGSNFGLTGPYNHGVRHGLASFYSYQIGTWDSSYHAVCASRDYPRGTKLIVRHDNTGVICVVTDYGPDASVFPERTVDLSPKVFEALAPLKLGVIPVTVEKL